MNLTQRIEAMEKELATLKAEAIKLVRFEMWEPKKNDRFYISNPFTETYTLNAVNERGYHDILRISRGLAFEHEADAAEVGKWLAVQCKIANLAKQLNKNIVCTKDEGFYCIIVDSRDFMVELFYTTLDRPRFHSRDAAETALSLLTQDEKETLIRGIS